MHIFVDLPFVAQRDLFDAIDYDTRSSLRKCSSRTQKLVDSLPIIIDNMWICLDPILMYFTEISSGGRKKKHNLLDYKEIRKWEKLETNPNIGKIEEGIEKLGEILENPNVRIGELNVCVRCMRPTRLATVMEERLFLLKLLKMKLISLNRRIRVEELNVSFSQSQDEIMCVLPFLQPEFLKTIVLGQGSETPLEMEKVTETEQWKKSKDIIMTRTSSRIPIEKIWHTPKLEIKFNSFTRDDLIRLCEHYAETAVPLTVAFGEVDFDWLPYDPIKNNIKKLKIQGKHFELYVVHYMDTNLVQLFTEHYL